MGIFRKLRDILAAPPVKGENPDLYPLDFDQIAKDLSVESEAISMGLLNKPTADKSSLSSIELRIVDRIEDYRAKVSRWSINQILDMNRKMSELDITKDVNRARESAQEFKREANDIISSYESELQQLHANKERLHADLERFKAENRLTRQPKKLMPALNKVLWFIVILLLVVVEGGVNAWFFSTGLDGGVMQGFIYAGSLAAINVLGGFALGLFALKRLWHVNPLWKAVGVLGLITSVALMLAIALFTTHLRDAFALAETAGNTDALKLALQTVVGAPFTFQGIDSVILFLMSCIFSILALAKGLTWEDIYPRYSAVYKRAIEAQAEYVQKFEHVHEALKDSKEDFEIRLEKVLEDASKAIVRYKEYAQLKASTGTRMSNYIAKAQHTSDALIGLFRTKNSLHRTEPEPAYFNHQVMLKAVEQPEIDSDPDLQNVARQEALINELLTQVEPIRAEIQSAFVLVYDQITPLRDHLKSA